MSIIMKITSSSPSSIEDSQEPVTTTEASNGTLADRVTAVLYEQIRSGVFAPDTRMPSENELTERFQVSRTVVREAISRLKSEGLVGSRLGSGTVVLAANTATPFRLDVDVRDSIDAVLRVIELRRGIEGEMAALAAQRRTEAQYQDMALALANIDKAVREGRDGVQEDFAFHAAISAAAHNSLYTSILEFLSQFLQASIRVARINEARREDFGEQVRREHAAILQAIANGDAAAARTAALQHMENSARRIKAADQDFWASEGGKAARHLSQVKAQVKV